MRVVREFILRINRGDVDALAELMTTDHLLVDSLGHRLRGRESIRRAWAAYFQMVPGYRVVVRETVVDGGTVVALGEARGRYAGVPGAAPVGAWRTSAAWRAVVRRGRLARWQIYADNEPMRALMRKASPAGRGQGRRRVKS